MKNHSVIEHDVKVAILESKFFALSDLINRNEKAVQNVEKDIETKYDKIDRCMERIENKVWSLLFWTIGGFAGVLGLLAHIKGWV